MRPLNRQMSTSFGRPGEAPAVSAYAGTGHGGAKQRSSRYAPCQSFRSQRRRSVTSIVGKHLFIAHSMNQRRMTGNRSYPAWLCGTLWSLIFSTGIGQCDGSSKLLWCRRFRKQGNAIRKKHPSLLPLHPNVGYRFKSFTLKKRSCPKKDRAGKQTVAVE